MALPGSSEWARLHYGPGWPRCSEQGSRLVSVKAFGRTMAWNKGAKRALVRLDRLFKENTPKYYRDICNDPARDTGAYNCRPIAGTSSPSNHSFGTAVDIDWQENARDGDYKSEMRSRGMSVIQKVEAEGFMRWGGRYSSPDDMHFEVMWTPDKLRAAYTWRGTKKKRWWKNHR